MRNALEGKVTDEKLYQMSQKTSVAELARKFKVNRQTINKHISKHAATFDAVSISGDVADTPIEELKLSVKAFNALSHADIKFVRDLTKKTEQDLLKTPGFGRKLLKEVTEVVTALGVHLKGKGVNGTSAPKPVEAPLAKNRHYLIRAGAGQSTHIGLDVEDLYVTGVGLPMEGINGCVLEVHVKAKVSVGDREYFADGNVDFDLEIDK